MTKSPELREIDARYQERDRAMKLFEELWEFGEISIQRFRDIEQLIRTCPECINMDKRFNLPKRK